MRKGLLPEKTRWYNKWWEKGHVIEKDGKKISWYWEHMIRTYCKERRPDLTLEVEWKKEINSVNMMCPAEENKIAHRNAKISAGMLWLAWKTTRIWSVKDHRMLWWRTERIKKRPTRTIYNEKTTELITKEMQKTVVWESDTTTRKIMARLIKWKVLFSFWVTTLC